MGLSVFLLFPYCLPLFLQDFWSDLQSYSVVTYRIFLVNTIKKLMAVFMKQPRVLMCYQLCFTKRCKKIPSDFYSILVHNQHHFPVSDAPEGSILFLLFIIDLPHVVYYMRHCYLLLIILYHFISCCFHWF